MLGVVRIVMFCVICSVVVVVGVDEEVVVYPRDFISLPRFLWAKTTFTIITKITTLSRIFILLRS